MFAAGAFILFSGSDTNETVRQEVTPPIREEVKAPDWVDEGQTAKPDYTQSNATQQDATPVPEEEEEETQVIEFKEDSVVTFTFVESFADFLLHRFIPTNENGIPATKATAKALNMYYGRELDGFDVPVEDIRTARKKVLDYAFTPGMLETLYNLYAPVLMAHLVETATNDDREYKVGVETERRPLTDTETAIMLKLNATRIEQTATTLRAIARNSYIADLAGQYIRASKAVERANEQLQNAIADEEDASRPSERLKHAIMQREQAKEAIAGRLKDSCPGCPDSELFYIAQWSYRRILGVEDRKMNNFAVAADILDDLADRFRASASELK